MTYTDAELKKMLEDVELQFNTHLAKKEEELQASLAKSEDKPFPPKDEKKPEEKPEEKKPEEKKPEGKEESKEPPKAAEGDKPQVPGEEKPSEQKPEGQPQPNGDEGHGYDDEDMDHMHKMYMSMSKAELKVHHDAVRSALDSQGMQKCGDMGMAKSETPTSIEVKVPDTTAETTLLKSELEAEKEKTAKLQKTVDLATEFMAKLSAKKSAPQGKAITSLEVIAKGEETKVEKSYTVSEVRSMLNKKASDPSLSKSDRDAINDYYLGSKNIKTVRHLLT
jgi:hypothetical protein